MAGDIDNKDGKTGDGDDAAKAAEAAKVAEAEAAKKKADEEAEKNKMVPHGAFHEEREKRKAAEAELKKFQDEKVAAEKKSAEEKGEFKKLYESAEEKAKRLEEENAGIKTKLTEFETAIKTRIDLQVEGIKVEEDKKMILSILDGKTLAQQETLLPGLLKKFGVPTNINAGADGGGKKEDGKDDKEVKRQEAAKSGDIMSLIANAPTI